MCNSEIYEFWCDSHSLKLNMYNCVSTGKSIWEFHKLAPTSIIKQCCNFSLYSNGADFLMFILDNWILFNLLKWYLCIASFSHLSLLLMFSMWWLFRLVATVGLKQKLWHLSWLHLWGESSRIMEDRDWNCDAYLLCLPSIVWDD